jgi:hypothetical protein
MPIFEFPMMFPADGVSLVGRVYRNVDDLVTPQPTVAVTGAWLTVKEQMARTYALRLAEQGITAFTFDFTVSGRVGARRASSSCRLARLPISQQRPIFCPRCRS